MIPPPSWSPAASLHNRIYELLRAAEINGVVPRVRGVDGFTHPFKVKAARATSLAAFPADSQPWRFDVTPGFVNDQPAKISYRRHGDRRGWSIPPEYVEDPPSSDVAFIDRDPLDIPDAPPFLIATDPPLGATEHDDWTLLTEAERARVENGALTGQSDWDQFPQCWRSHVVLAANPAAATYSVALPAARLQRMRLFVSKTAPGINYTAQIGGQKEIATLYLLRDPARPQSAEIRVRQQLWWPLWAAVIQPDRALLAGALSAEDQLAVENALGNTAFLEFWSV